MNETQLVYEQMRCKIQTLEKENAELKEDVKYYEQKHERLVTEWDNAKRQLTKAKEIIKDLLGSENTSCEEEMFFEIRQKAEQFLKEIK